MVKMTISILHNTPNVGRESFGLGHVALNLAKAQNEIGCIAKIWCQNEIEDIHGTVASICISEKQIVSFPAIGIASLAYSQAMMCAAKINSDGFNIVHQHGIWTACSQVSNVFRRKHRTPVIIAPHGSLQKWALKRSVLKKKLALLAYENENLQHAACLHATAEAEITDFRDFGLRNPIALIPNGVSEQWLNSSGIAKRFLDHFNLPKDRCIIFFLSRITPKKGLPMLLQAIHRVRCEFAANWTLVIAGVDEFNHKKEIESLVEKLRLQDLVKLIGPLYDQIKLDAFAASHVFVLPSYSEGAPIIVLESLAAGVPVITTKGTSWENLITYQSGWWVDASVDGLVDALRCMMVLSPMHLEEMGKRGKELVRSQYLWLVQAQKTHDLYAWLLGRKPKPDFVISD